MLAFGPLKEPPVRLSCATPLLAADSVWKLVPPGLAYMSPSSAFGSGSGLGIVLMSGWQDGPSSTRRERAAQDAAVHEAPLLLLTLGDPPPCDAPDQNAVLAVWSGRPPSTSGRRSAGAGSPPSPVSVVHVGTASESASITAGAPVASASPGCPPLAVFE